MGRDFFAVESEHPLALGVGAGKTKNRALEHAVEDRSERTVILLVF